jgi:hypothetical protein
VKKSLNASGILQRNPIYGASIVSRLMMPIISGYIHHAVINHGNYQLI